MFTRIRQLASTVRYFQRFQKYFLYVQDKCTIGNFTLFLTGFAESHIFMTHASVGRWNL